MTCGFQKERIAFFGAQEALKQKCQRAEQVATRGTEDPGLPGAVPESAVALGYYCVYVCMYVLLEWQMCHLVGLGGAVVVGVFFIRDQGRLVLQIHKDWIRSYQVKGAVTKGAEGRVLLRLCFSHALQDDNRMAGWEWSDCENKAESKAMVVSSMGPSGSILVVGNDSRVVKGVAVHVSPHYTQVQHCVLCSPWMLFAGACTWSPRMKLRTWQTLVFFSLLLSLPID